MVLYHVSKISGLKVLKPFSHNAMDGEKAVFATNDIMFALSMAYGTGNDIAVGYHCNTKTKEKEFYIDELEKGKLKLLDNVASIYIVEETNFVNDDRLLKEEFISKKEVKVIKEIIVKSALKELEKLKANIIKYDDVLVSMKQRNKNPKKPKKKKKKKNPKKKKKKKKI